MSALDSNVHDRIEEIRAGRSQLVHVLVDERHQMGRSMKLVRECDAQSRRESALQRDRRMRMLCAVGNYGGARTALLIGVKAAHRHGEPAVLCATAPE